ncbi:MAG: family 20 glycosylhydrolase [Mucinivorans sp.]
MKKIVMVALAALAIGCSPKIEMKPYNAGINVIPVPRTLSVRDSTYFTVTANTVIVATSADFANPAAYLAAKIKASTGYDLKITEAAPATNFIALQLNTRVAVGAEGYTLSSSNENVIIESRTPQGAFYGVQTLLQLLPAEIESPKVIRSVAWTLPSVDVVDEPRFAYRGLMMDVVRHFVDVDFIKKQLDVLAMFKINRFHWHLTDDQGWRIEIKKYPKLTTLGSMRTEGDGSIYGPFFYTQDQIKEVVAYASERYIDVIPEIELPGHGLAALTAYPEYACLEGNYTPRIIWGVEEDVFCVGKEESFKFWQDVLDEVVTLFPSQYIHIGADECPKLRWKECAKCQARARELGLKENTQTIGDRQVHHSVEEQLQSYAVGRMGQYIASKGKQMIGWDEILEGGLAQGAVVMSWRGTQGGIDAATQGHEVIMTPGSGGMYIDTYQGAVEVEPVTIGGYAPLEKTYSYEPVPAELDSTKAHFIMGAQTNMWSEYLLSADLYEYMIYPRVLALAELTWSPASKKDFVDFSRRINNAYVRLDYHNIGYHIPQPEGVLTKNVVFTGDTVSLAFNNTRNYPMVYTTDGSQVTARSTQYTGPIVMKENGVVKIATLLQSGKLSVPRTIVVERESLAPAVNPDSSAMKNKPGQTIRARVAKGLFPNPKEYANAQWSKDTLLSSFQGIDFDYKAPSLAVYEGYVNLPEDGVYTFTTDMNELFIDGVRLIDNNSVASRHNNQKVQKALAAGKHAYKLVMNNMVQNGWPQSWNVVGFAYRLPSGGDFLMADPSIISY